VKPAIIRLNGQAKSYEIFAQCYIKLQMVSKAMGETWSDSCVIKIQMLMYRSWY